MLAWKSISFNCVVNIFYATKNSYPIINCQILLHSILKCGIDLNNLKS